MMPESAPTTALSCKSRPAPVYSCDFRPNPCFTKATSWSQATQLQPTTTCLRFDTPFYGL